MVAAARVGRLLRAWLWWPLDKDNEAVVDGSCVHAESVHAETQQLLLELSAQPHLVLPSAICLESHRR